MNYWHIGFIAVFGSLVIQFRSEVSVFADDVISPTPACVNYTVHEVHVGTLSPNFTLDRTFVGIYRAFGELRLNKSWSKGATDQGNRNPVSYQVFREGELIHGYFGFIGKKVNYRNLLLVSNKANPKLPISVPGDISQSNPVVGGIGGYLFEDYFPKNGTTFSTDGTLVRAVATTRFGHAEAWFDDDSNSFPVRVVVQKKPGDLISGGRKIESVLFDSYAPESLLKTLRCEITVAKFERTVLGEVYPKICVIEEFFESNRGFEGTFRKTWEVQSIDFSPQTTLGEVLFSEFGVKDGDKVDVHEANQVPYIWSVKEQWAIPDQRFVVTDEPSFFRSYRFFIILTIVTTSLMGLLVYKYRVGRG